MILPPSSCTRRASALVISLIFVVMLTIIALATVIGVRLERTSANSHLDKVQAELFTLMALDDAVARLRLATAETNAVWISQPGRMVVSDPGAAAAFKLQKEIFLHSGTAGPGSPSLNVPSLHDPANFLIRNEPSHAGGLDSSDQRRRPNERPLRLLGG